MQPRLHTTHAGQPGRRQGRRRACAPGLARRLLARLTAVCGCQAHAEAVARFRRIVPGGKISMALDSARS
jgi:hypothetical protein